MTDQTGTLRATPPLAIVGLACRFPDADDPAALLDVVLSGRRSFRRLPPGRIDLADYYQPDLATSDATYSTRAAVIEGWRFEHGTFGVGEPAYLAADPAHWLALETAARALSAAGLPGGAGLNPDRTGVIIGNTLAGDTSRANALRVRWPYVRRVLTDALGSAEIPASQAGPVLRQAERTYLAPFVPMGPASLAGSMPGTIPAAISSHFGFRGGSHTIDSACSSALQAVASACAALITGDLDAAIAGGVDLNLDPLELIGLAKAGLLATGEVRIYDQHPTGYLPGEGCGVVVLMRTADARAAGLQVYAEILGWGVSGGAQPAEARSQASSQLLAMQRAYERSSIDPADIHFIEGNGAGTALADEAELTALNSIRAGAKRSAALGSVKANIGHAQSAAGAAGLIKAVLALSTGVVPPTTGAQVPHKLVTDGDGKLALPSAAQEWEPGTRFAAVSTTGMGGSNVHVVLRHEPASRGRQERKPKSPLLAKASASRPADSTPRELSPAPGAMPFLLHAPDRFALAAVLSRIADIGDWLSDAELHDLACVLGRDTAKQGKARVALVATRQEQLTMLAREAVTMLPYLGGGLVAVRPGIFASDDAAGSVTLLLSADPIGHLKSGPAPAALSPAVQHCLETLRWLGSLEVHATAAVGHGVGMLAGLAWAGALGEAEVREIADLRAQFLLRSAQRPESADARAGRPAAARQPNDQSGTADLSAAIAQRFRFGPPRRRLISTATGRAVESVADAIDLICNGLSGADRVAEALTVGAAGASLLLETGPGHTLATAAAELTKVPAISLASGLTDSASSARAAAALYAAGALEDPQPLFAGRPARPLDIWREQVFITSPCARLRVRSQAPEPASAEDAFAEPAFAEPAFAEPAFAEPVFVGPASDEAALAEDALAEDALAEDARTVVADEPETAERGPVIAEPAVQVAVAEPAVTEPAVQVPVTEPAPTEPAVQVPVTEPAPTEPTVQVPVTEPAVTEPTVTEPAVTEPAVTEPTVSGPLPAPTTPHADGLSTRRAEFERRLPGHPLIEAAAARPAPPAGSPAQTEPARQLSMAQPGTAPSGTGWPAPASAGLNPAGDEIAVPTGRDSTPPAGLGSWARCFTAGMRTVQHLPAEGGNQPWRLYSAARSQILANLCESFEADPAAGRTLAVVEDPSDERSRAAAIEAAKDAITTGELVVLTTSCGFTGFFASLHAEHPSIGITILLILDDTVSPASVLQLATAEPGQFRDLVLGPADAVSESILTEVALTGGGDFALGSDDVIVLTRATRGAGLALAQVLACTGTGVALIGKPGEHDESQLIAGFEALRAAGARVGYEIVDVADRPSLTAAVKRIEDRLGPVTAIAHAAGLDDPVPVNEIAEPQAVTRASDDAAILGLLAGAIPGGQLRLIISVGTVASRYGFAGASLHALSSAVLASRAGELAAATSGCEVLHLDMPGWAADGLGDRPELAAELAAADTELVDLAGGARLLLKVMSTPGAPRALAIHGRVGGLPASPVPVITQAELTAAGLTGGSAYLRDVSVHYPATELVCSARLTLASDPYLADYRLDGMPVLPPVLALEALAEAASVLAGRPLRRLTNVALESPVLIPTGRAAALRICALRNGDRIVAALRCAESSYLVDHARAVFSCAAEPPELPRAGTAGSAGALQQLSAASAGLVDGAELYGPVSFQAGRFRRIALMPEVTARSGRALARGRDEQAWFPPGSALADAEFLLGSPGLNDAALQVLQACVPHRRVRAAGCESVQFSGRPAEGPVEIRAVAEPARAVTVGARVPSQATAPRSEMAGSSEASGAQVSGTEVTGAEPADSESAGTADMATAGNSASKISAELTSPAAHAAGTAQPNAPVATAPDAPAGPAGHAGPGEQTGLAADAAGQTADADMAAPEPDTGGLPSRKARWGRRRGQPIAPFAATAAMPATTAGGGAAAVADHPVAANTVAANTVAANTVAANTVAADTEAGSTLPATDGLATASGLADPNSPANSPTRANGAGPANGTSADGPAPADGTAPANGTAARAEGRGYGDGAHGASVSAGHGADGHRADARPGLSPPPDALGDGVTGRPAPVPLSQLWNVEAVDANGQLVAAWRGVRLRDAGPLPRNAAWPPTLLSVYLERRAADLGLDDGLRVAVSCGYPDGPLPQLLAAVPQPALPADDAPPVEGRHAGPERQTLNTVTAEGAGALAGFRLTLRAPVAVACGWVAAETGHRHHEPAAGLAAAYGQLRAELSEQPSVLAVRLEAVRAALQMAGLQADDAGGGQLRVIRTASDGWALFRLDRVLIASAVVELSGVAAPVAVAMLTKQYAHARGAGREGAGLAAR